ncbi:hypothetical protein CR513_60971, partial [Mucuna pruriens]
MFIPNVYWGEVILTITYLINKLLTRILNDISSIKHMLSFFPSSPLMLSVPSRVFRKLDSRAIKCVFISYPSNKKELKCYHPLSRQVESYLEVESIIKSLPFPTQDVQVQEVTKPTLVPNIPKNPIEDVTDDMFIALRKGKQSCVKYPISQIVCTDHLFLQHQSFIVAIDAIKTPTSVQEALKNEN